MTKSIVGLLVVAVLAFLALDYFYPSSPYNHWHDRFVYPTDTRVRYRIGAVDPRFGLSDDELAAVVDQAVQVWQDGIGRTLFVHDDHARLVINLVYDERQQTTKERKAFETWFDTAMSEHKDQEKKLAHERSLLILEQQRIEQRIQNKETSPLLLQQIERFYEAQDRYNEAVDRYNQQGQHINRENQIARRSFAPKQFHKGEFDGRTINVYEFESLKELQLVLAHEFGHALGLGHTDEPTSLMYPLAGEQPLSDIRLGGADVALFYAHGR